MSEKTDLRLKIPVAFNGILQSQGDQDWFVFSAKKDQQLEFRLYARGMIRSPVDGVVEVYRMDGRRLSSNDDSGGEPDPSFRLRRRKTGSSPSA